MYKEVEEMTKSYCDRTVECKRCDRYYECDLTEICEAIYDDGYRKTVWHKVSDGDLPKKVGQYLCKNKTGSYCCLNYSLIDNAFLEQDTTTKDFYVTNKVIAWTELPEYNGD